jgi:predicted ribosomally synthesized peptide with nif11-like leader
MSLEQAMAFISGAARDPALKRRLVQMQPKNLAEIAVVGAETGHDFTVEELRQAFAWDWGLRWHLFRAKTEGGALRSRP